MVDHGNGWLYELRLCCLMWTKRIGQCISLCFNECPLFLYQIWFQRGRNLTCCLPSYMRLALFGGTIFRIQCHSLHMSNRGNKSRNTRRKRWAYTCKWIYTHINKYNIVYEHILSFLFMSRLLYLERMWQSKEILNVLQ